jgi:aspartate aminotransferase
MDFIAEKLKNIKPSATLTVAKLASEMKKQGLDVISLATGEPDFDTPIYVKQAAIKAIDEGFTKYTAVDGIIELKTQVIKKFSEENNLSYSLDEVTIGSGAKQIIFNALMASLNPGDEVVIPAPYWVSYPEMVALLGGVPVILMPDLENFKFSASALSSKITAKTKWLIINCPSNPTGVIYEPDELASILKVVEENNHVGIISDDIYEHIIFDKNKFVTAAEVNPSLKERIITVNGVSKSHAMTGWRIGYAGGPAKLIKAMNIIQSQSTSGACSISQKAAVAALEADKDFINSSQNIFQTRKNLVVGLLNEINGISCASPRGAFYVFPECKKLLYKSYNGKLITNSNEFALFLLEEAHVAVVAGSAFGMEGFFRVSFATSEENLRLACARIKEAINKLS